MLNRLRVKRPAATSSAIDSAICDVASAVRKRAAARAPDGLPGLPLERRDQVGRAWCAAPGRARTAGRSRWSARRRSSTTVGVELELERGHCLGRQQRRDQLAASTCATSSPRGAAEHSQQARLGQQLARPAAAGWRRWPAARPSRRDRAAAAGQQQVRDVRARDEQDESPSRRAAAISGPFASRRHRGLPVRSRLEQDRLRPEPRHRLLAHPLLQRRLDVVDDRAILRRPARPRACSIETPGLSRRTGTPSSCAGFRTSFASAPGLRAS